MTLNPPGEEEEKSGPRHFTRGLGLFDSSMIVIGIMVGSGIFIVPAEMARLIASPGWLLVAWVVTGVLTVTAGLTYGELAAMMPEAGGMYVYLREAFSPLIGFLYGWTLWTVIQTGTIAAVAIAFARFAGVLMPSIADNHYLIAPVHVVGNYFISLSTTQLLAISIVVLLTFANSLGLELRAHSSERFYRRENWRAGGVGGSGLYDRHTPRGGDGKFPPFLVGAAAYFFCQGNGCFNRTGNVFGDLHCAVGIVVCGGCVARYYFRCGGSEESIAQSAAGAWPWDLVGDCAVPAGKPRLSLHVALERDPACAL